MAPGVAGGGRACRVRGRLPPPPGSRPDCAAGPAGQTQGGPRRGPPGRRGGASLALCGRRRNSLCPFLAAAATRRPLHVDEAAPGAPSFPRPRPRGLRGGGGGRPGPTGGPGVGAASGVGSRAVGGAWGAGVAVQGGCGRGGPSKSGGGDLGVGAGRPWGDVEGRPPGEASALALPSECGILGALRLPPQRRVQADSLKGDWRRRGAGEAHELCRLLIVLGGGGV